MLEYSIGFLKDYGVHILAEGVETVEQAKILIEKGVEYLQGYYYSRPLPADEFVSFLKAGREVGRARPTFDFENRIYILLSIRRR